MQNQTKPENNQDVFNRVWRHFIVEKFPKCMRSWYDREYCLYRSDNNGCAIGCMLPDNLAIQADKCHEYCGNNSIYNVIEEIQEIKNWFKNVDFGLLAELQRAHDGFFSELENRLRKIAIGFKLTIPT